MKNIHGIVESDISATKMGLESGETIFIGSSEQNGDANSYIVGEDSEAITAALAETIKRVKQLCDRENGDCIGFDIVVVHGEDEEEDEW